MTNAELFKQTFGRYATEVWALPEDEFLEWLNADVQQKTGRWVFDELLDKHYYCSECKSMGVDYWDYCPNCGAKMEVEGNG